MSRSRDLPIYHAGYALLKLVTEAVGNFPRDHRATLGNRIQSEVIGLVIQVYRANAAVDKRAHIAQLLENLEVVELMIQLLFDMRLISSEVFAKFCEILPNIGKQAGGWKKYADRQAACPPNHVGGLSASPVVELPR